MYSLFKFSLLLEFDMVNKPLKENNYITFISTFKRSLQSLWNCLLIEIELVLNKNL